MPETNQVDAGAFSQDIRDFMRCLQEHGVRHMIVGGNAVIFHGFIRYTGDVDFFYEDTAEKPVGFVDCVARFLGRCSRGGIIAG